MKPSGIGVIAPFRAQVHHLKAILSKCEVLRNDDDKTDYDQFSKIEVNTVDQYQGRDKEVSQLKIKSFNI